MSNQPTRPRAAGQTSPRLGRQSRPHPDLHAQLTDKVIAILETGVLPWRAPILDERSAGHPTNLATGRRYRGINVFLLAWVAYRSSYKSAYWVTSIQAKELGGTVKNGEMASNVVYWKPQETVDPHTGDPVTAYSLQHYQVFNVMQCKGIFAPDVADVSASEDVPSRAPREISQIEAAEAILDGYATGPEIDIGGHKAFYRPSTDTIHMTERDCFETPEAFYATLFHELTHSTGHFSRHSRGLGADLPPFGSPEYTRESLIAEIGAALLCSEAGISPSVFKTSANDVSGWLGALKKDSRLLISASGAAQKAVDLILGRPPGLREMGPEEL